MDDHAQNPQPKADRSLTEPTPIVGTATPQQPVTQDVPQEIAAVPPIASNPTVASAPVQDQQIVHKQTNLPVQPVGGMNKEAGPMIVEQPLHEVLQPTEQVPNLEQEVAEAGVEITKNPEEAPDLTLHDQHAGITHAPAITPVPAQPTTTIAITTEKEQIQQELKKEHNPANARSWWLVERLKMIKKQLLGGEQ